jgi:hypothetical protein
LHRQEIAETILRMNPNLFDPDLEKRYKATIKSCAGAESKPYGCWPRACWGAANGWLMICGPSPGREDDPKKKWRGGPNRPNDQKVRIGQSVAGFDFQTNKGRNTRWLNLAKSVLVTEEKAKALASVANLDWGHNPSQYAINQKLLELGCETVFSLMKRSKPRVIVVLGVRTWNVISRFVQDKDYVIPVQDAPDWLTRKPFVIQIPGSRFRSLLLKAPQHPSRHFFNDEHCRRINRAVKWFVEKAG